MQKFNVVTIFFWGWFLTMNRKKGVIAKIVGTFTLVRELILHTNCCRNMWKKLEVPYVMITSSVTYVFPTLFSCYLFFDKMFFIFKGQGCSQRELMTSVYLEFSCYLLKSTTDNLKKFKSDTIHHTLTPLSSHYVWRDTIITIGW